MAGFFKSLFNKITNRAEIDWDDIEADLIASDIGIHLTTGIIEELRALGREISANDVVETTRLHLARRLPEDSPPPTPRADGKPFVILIVGVNGTGKTTSSAKLGLWLKNRGHSVILAAADTFRAAAVEQLQRWAERLNLPVVKGNPNADPSSVCFNAHQKATTNNVRWGALSSCFASVRRIFPSSCIRLWRVWMRPAVSQMRKSVLVVMAF